MNDIAKSAVNNLDSSSWKSVNHKMTCFLDFSDEILLLICRYLSPYHVLYSFYTSSTPAYRLHRVISDYYRMMKLDRLTNNEYYSLLDLFSSEPIPQLESLVLSCEFVTCLINDYFTRVRPSTIGSMFINLKSLKLLDCATSDLEYLLLSFVKCPKLEDLHIRIKKSNENQSVDDFYLPILNVSINQIIFNEKLFSIETLVLEINNGISLNKSLLSQRNLRNINLNLKTIDDLFLLLDGLVPNVQTMIIHLCQKRILSCIRPKSTSVCLQLHEFTLLEPRIGFVLDDLKSIFHFMPNLNKLTLSIRDTPDPLFCHGPSFESILTEYLPNLRQFDYTMTHRIIDQQLIEDFIRWPMHFVHYENENSKWIHIYSLPWPSSRDDPRRLPIVQSAFNTSVRSDVKRSEYMEHVLITKSEELLQLNTKFIRVQQLTTSLPIQIQLPQRIWKLILLEQTHLSSLNGVIYPSVHHLIVECRLIGIDQLSNLAHRFPHVKYLELLYSLPESSFLSYLKAMFRLECKLWPELINLTISICFPPFQSIWNDHILFNWLIENTDLKYHPSSFYVRYLHSKIAIWF